MIKNNPKSKKIPEEFKEYIFYNHGSFAVKNDKNRVLITFGRFKSEDVACAATNLLIKHDWDMSEVVNDLVSSYLDETYVFKVMNNNLIFDLKFNSYEEAVEYSEINSRCNDYHNDILRKKKRKPKYSNSNQEILIEYNDIPNIFQEKNKFVVKYKSNGKIYGVFNLIDEAIVAKQLLIENNWHFSSSAEMKFHNSFYWIFKIKSNVLFFIDKFESYEDALDCLDSIKSNKDDEGLNFGKFIKKINNKYVDDVKRESYVITDNFKKSISSDSNFKNTISKNDVKSSNRKSKSKKKRRKIKKSKYIHPIPKVKRKITRDNIKIKTLEEFIEGAININFENLKLEFNIIQFKDNVLTDYYTIYFLNKGEIKFSRNMQQLKEFGYILKILTSNGWDLTKINASSSIHYINDAYYILKSFNGKLIISGSFDSYVEAEENIEFLHDYYSSKMVIPNDIQKHGDYYKYIGEHNYETFEINYQKSLETLKSIIDIFDYYNWDPLEFEDYNIYYYHGIYWDIEFFNYYIKLKGRFYSKEDAIKHKLSN